MARKKPQPPPPPSGPPKWHVHIGQDANGGLHLLRYETDDGLKLIDTDPRLTPLCVVDVGRRLYLASAGRIAIDGMTGSNAEPWSADELYAAARFNLFGMKFSVEPAHGQEESDPGRCSPAGTSG